MATKAERLLKQAVTMVLRERQYWHYRMFPEKPFVPQFIQLRGMELGDLLPVGWSFYYQMRTTRLAKDSTVSPKGRRQAKRVEKGISSEWKDMVVWDSARRCTLAFMWNITSQSIR